MKKILFTVFLFVFFVTNKVQGSDFSTPSVPLSHPAYSFLEILKAHDLIETQVMGHRPWTRLQFAKWAGEADQRQVEKTAFVQSIINQLKKDFKNEIVSLEKNEIKKLQFNPLEKVFITAEALDLSPRGYFELPSATYNPLTNFDEGRHKTSGFQMALESSHSLQVSPFFSAYLQPRLQAQFISNSGRENNIFLHEFYGTLTFLKHKIDIGRKTFVLGQGEFGGMILSNHARPLDSIQLTNLNPWRIKHFGKIKYTFFFSWLGPEQNFSDPFLTGGKLTYLPNRYLEFGVTRAMILGGKGSPTGSFFDYVAEFFAARPGDINLVNLSNSINGVDWLVTVPGTRGLTTYGEISFEDANLQKIFRSIEQDSGILLGLTLPRLDKSGSLGVSLEGRRTTSIMYTHGIWTTGWTLNQFILGDPLGPGALSLNLKLKKIFSPKYILLADIGLEKSESDHYSGSPTAGRVKTVDGPSEKRWRTKIDFSYPLNKKITLLNSVGYEHVWGFNFIPGQKRDNFLARIQAIIDFK